MFFNSQGFHLVFPCVPNENLNISFKQISTSYQVFSLSVNWTKWCSYQFSIDRNSPHVHSRECYQDDNEEFTNPIVKVSLQSVRGWDDNWRLSKIAYIWRVSLHSDSFHVFRGNGEEVKGFFFFTTPHIQVKVFLEWTFSCLLHDLGLQKASPHHLQS